MRLGFVGTGEITSAIVTGLNSAGGEVRSIVLSPRNATVASDLANRFPGVSVASSNQDVLDSCEAVVIAVRPVIARSTLSALRFRPDHHIISLVSALSRQSLFQLAAPATHITRAVPLPSTASRISPTAIYPADPETESLFASIGTVFNVATETEFDAMCAATATIASFYAFMEGIASWLSGYGVSEAKSRDYVARIFWGMTTAAVESQARNFSSLSNGHATPGGINEQFRKHMLEHGFGGSVRHGLDAVLERIRAAGQD